MNDARLPDIGFESYDSMEGLIAIDRSARPARFGSWPGAKLIHAVYPGLLVAGTIALASTWLAQHYTAPVMLFALLFGMAFHFLHEEGRCVAGIEFASRSVLRLGVGMLGVRITLGQPDRFPGPMAGCDGDRRRRDDNPVRLPLGAPLRPVVDVRRPFGRRGRDLRRFRRSRSPPSCHAAKRASATPSSP